MVGPIGWPLALPVFSPVLRPAVQVDLKRWPTRGSCSSRSGVTVGTVAGKLVAGLAASGRGKSPWLVGWRGMVPRGGST